MKCHSDLSYDRVLEASRSLDQLGPPPPAAIIVHPSVESDGRHMVSIQREGEAKLAGHILGMTILSSPNCPKDFALTCQTLEQARKVLEYLNLNDWTGVFRVMNGEET